MAELIKKPSLLRRKYSRSRGKMYLGYGGACLLLTGGLLLWLGWQLPAGLLLLPVAVLCSLVAAACGKQSRILASGLQGEARAARLLQKLPASYRCYQNLVLRRGGRSCEIDLLVTGPCGVFVLEVKNQRGKLRGDGAGAFWQQEKTGRRGGRYSKQMKNPVRQVGSHMSCLAGWLEDRGWQLPVNGAVYFSDPQTMVQVKDLPRRIPVFAAGQDGDRALLQYIRSRDGRLSGTLLQQLDRIWKTL